MHYRVVLQGRTMGGADVEEVKKEFVRVTGLPAPVAGEYFNGMPHAIKRKVSKADAERIAATLRAIGAAATVEREVADGAEHDEGEIRLVSNPLMSGPPTVIPGMAGAAMAAVPARQAPRWMRDLREKWPVIVGALALGAGALHLAPVVDEFIQTVKPAPAPVIVPKRAPIAEVAPVEPTLNPTLAHGPWRCTDQRSGIAAYWTFQDSGALVYHGDTFKDGALVASDATSMPSAWKLDGDRLDFVDPDGTVDSFAVHTLTLANLRYGDNRRRIEIDCRRP